MLQLIKVLGKLGDSLVFTVNQKHTGDISHGIFLDNYTDKVLYHGFAPVTLMR